MNSASSTSSGRSLPLSSGLSLEPHFIDGVGSLHRSLELQAAKSYMSGYLRKKNDLGPDKTPFIQRRWTEWYVELNGTTLMFWSVKSPTDCEFPRVEAIKKKAPNFINVADCNVYPTKLDEADHVFILNSAGANRIWMLALRLACFEAALLHEWYTGLMLETELYAPLLSEGSAYSGFVEMRCSGILEWGRYWMAIRTDASGPLITFSPAKYSTDLVFTLDCLQLAYAIFPDQDDFTDYASVLRLDGSVCAHRESAVNLTNPPFILVMAPSQREMLTILVAAFDAFQLHGRPRRFTYFPLPDSQNLYLDLPEVMAVPSVDESFFASRQAFCDLAARKFATVTSSPASAAPGEPSPVFKKEGKVFDSGSESDSHEENEFEPPTYVRKSYLANSKSDDLGPELRQLQSVFWKEQDGVVAEPSSGSLSPVSPKSLDLNEIGLPSYGAPQEKPISHDNAGELPFNGKVDEPPTPTQLVEVEGSDVDPTPKPATSKKGVKFVSPEDSEDTKSSPTKPSTPAKPDTPAQPQDSDPLPKARLARSVTSENSDSDEAIRLRVTKEKPIANAKNRRPKQLESEGESSSDEPTPGHGIRPSSAFTPASPHPHKVQARPFTMASQGKRVEKANFPKRHPRSKVRLPTASDASSDEGPQKEPGLEDDDAPIGTSLAQADPNAVRASMLNQSVEYAPDGMPTYYDPQAMAAFNAYNPALQRPSTLLEAQEFARYNDQLALTQPRYGPLIQLGAKEAKKPSGGLVGAISAIEQQRAANRYTNANARLHPPEQPLDRGFERQKERYLAEQRAMATQSQLYPPEAYGHYPMQLPPHPAPPHTRSPYGNVSASLSAGSFYHSPYVAMSPPTMPAAGLNHPGYPPMGTHSSYFLPPNRSQDDLAFPRAYHPNDPGVYTDEASRPAQSSTPDEDDDKPVGAVMANKPAASTNPMLAKGRYREHTVTQLKVKRDEDEDETESEPEIDDDVQETFDEFVDCRLQMKPYAYAALEKVFQAFADHCQGADLDPEDVPDPKTFAYMMGQAGFVCKKRPPTNEEMWYNIAIVEE
ncbi:hypothetical protein L0F63_006264 [Massospora cicadina]|nr:hypothetical protein L0F63_006264 [Massospora cicadina]